MQHAFLEVLSVTVLIPWQDRYHRKTKGFFFQTCLGDLRAKFIWKVHQSFVSCRIRNWRSFLERFFSPKCEFQEVLPSRTNLLWLSKLDSLEFLKNALQNLIQVKYGTLCLCWQLGCGESWHTADCVCGGKFPSPKHESASKRMLGSHCSLNQPGHFLWK